MLSDEEMLYYSPAALGDGGLGNRQGGGVVGDIFSAEELANPAPSLPGFRALATLVRTFQNPLRCLLEIVSV